MSKTIALLSRYRIDVIRESCSYKKDVRNQKSLNIADMGKCVRT